MARSTRDRMLDSATLLLRERGATALTIDAVLHESGAPRGSVYHHFPGGRDEIILDAAARAGERISTMLEQCAASSDSHAALDQFVTFWKGQLHESSYRAGCPVLALAIDSRSDVPHAAEVVRDLFERWQRILTRMLIREGHTRARARRLATTILASIEGAIILCRARGTATPLNDVAMELHLLLNTGEQR